MRDFEKRGSNQEDVAEIIRRKLEEHKGVKIIRKPIVQQTPKKVVGEKLLVGQSVPKKDLPKKPKSRKIFIIILVIVIILAFIGILAIVFLFVYPSILGSGDIQRELYNNENVRESFVINEERAIVRLEESINLEEVDSLEIVFSAEDDSIYVYNPSYADSEYEIYAAHLDLETFENIIVVRVSFNYKLEQDQNDTPIIILTTNQTINQINETTYTGGGGGGGGEECTHTCSSLGYECGTQSVCGFNVDCGTCGIAEICLDKKCLSKERLVSYWNFDGNAQDSISDNHGTVNGTTLTKGISGQAYEFDGIEDSIEVGYVSELDGLDQLTVCAFFKTSAEGSAGIIRKSDYGWLLYKSASTDSFGFYVGEEGNSWNATISGTSQINDRMWHYACGVYESSGLKLYVDGQNEGEMEGLPPTKLAESSDSIVMGNWHDSLANGTIDEVKIWNYALNESKIKEEYEELHERMVSYWNFDGNAQDSISDNHGTVNRATLTQGISGQAYEFDGIRSYVGVESPSELHFNNNFSISFWAKINQYPTKDEAFFISKGNEYSIALDETGALYYLFRNTDPGWLLITTFHILPKNTWAHILLTYELNNSATFYVDGQEVHSRQVSGEILDHYHNFTIGRRAIFTSEEPFNGTIDEVKIWNYPLSKQEISYVYNENAPPVASLSPFFKLWELIKNLF